MIVNIIKTILRWIGIAFFGTSFLVYISISLVSAISFAIIAIVLIPQVWRYLSKNKMLKIASIITLIIVFFIGLHFVPKTSNTKVTATATTAPLKPTTITVPKPTATTTPLKPTIPTATPKPTATTAPPKPTATPKPTSKPTPTLTPIPKDINGFPMNAEVVTVANLDKAPSTYEGKKVTFTCIVVGFAKNSNGNATAVNCSDPNDFMSMVQVDTILFDMTKINKNDTVRFYGLCNGSAIGKNAYGGDVSETLITAFGINDITSGYKE